MSAANVVACVFYLVAAIVFFVINEPGAGVGCLIMNKLTLDKE